MKKSFGFYLVPIVLLVIAGCSPRVVNNPKIPAKEKPEPTTVTQPVKRFTEANIALLIPFNLNDYNLETLTKAKAEKADMPIDFYQGVVLGMDSAAALGLNFKVNVFDTRDETSQLANLLKKESVKKSNLIIGPVFPDGVKYISNFSITNNIPVISPLAASKPSDFNNPNLISVINDINQHAAKVADYIGNHYQSNHTIVVLINPKKTADEQFAAPIRSRLKLKYPSFIVQEFTSTYAFETRMIKEKQYAVIICSSDMSFVTPSIDKLFKLKNLKSGGFDIDLYGHPNWLKQNYNVTQLQDLKTIVSTSYRIDYKNERVIDFIRKYRAKYNYEPSEYSFKGFDIGFYFAKLLVKHGPDYLNYLTKEKYKGLHNTFDFEYNPKYGYVNKELMLLQYRNLTLNVVD